MRRPRAPRINEIVISAAGLSLGQVQCANGALRVTRVSISVNRRAGVGGVCSAAAVFAIASAGGCFEGEPLTWKAGKLHKLITCALRADFPHRFRANSGVESMENSELAMIDLTHIIVAISRPVGGTGASVGGSVLRLLQLIAQTRHMLHFASGRSRRRSGPTDSHRIGARSAEHSPRFLLLAEKASTTHEKCIIALTRPAKWR